MNYKYIPDTYNYNFISEKNIDKNNFVNLQIKYRRLFEKYLLNYINMNQINKYINDSKVDIPRIKDKEYNFYHLSSNLNSNYIYLRNNIHIENLTNEEILYLVNNDNFSDDFIINTYQRVLYEEGDTTYFGIPNERTEVNSKTIIFEFAYDQKECQTLKQLNEIEEIINNCFNLIRKYLTQKSSIKPSFIVYNAIPDYYYEENIVLK